MKLNPELIQYLNEAFAPEVQEVIAERFGISSDDIPSFSFNSEIPGENNLANESIRQTRASVNYRKDGVPESILENPSSLLRLAEYYLRIADDGNQIAELATKHNTSEHDIRESIVQGAGFDVVVQALLHVVCTTFTDEDVTAIREVAKERLKLERRSSSK